MKKIVALLPMKANSSRVPGKNFKSFCGKPLFRWVLDNLLKVDEISEIVINTDARDILIENGLVESGRVRIRQRPKKICGDDISMNLVIADDIENVDADIYLMTHTTNPLLSVSTIRSAIKEFEEYHNKDEADSLFTVNKIQTRFYKENGHPINHDPQNLIPTQNLEPWYEENSNLYIFTSDSFQTTNARIGRNPKLFITPLRESVDIDTPEDWEMGVTTTQYMIDKKIIKI